MLGKQAARSLGTSLCLHPDCLPHLSHLNPSSASPVMLPAFQPSKGCGKKSQCLKPLLVFFHLTLRPTNPPAPNVVFLENIRFNIFLTLLSHQNPPTQLSADICHGRHSQSPCKRFWYVFFSSRLNTRKAAYFT